MPLEKPTTKNLTKLCFLDSATGWTVGDGGTILKTTNGGENWIIQNSGITSSIVDIYMLSNQLGWALAHNLPGSGTEPYGTIILKTTNGGNSWQSQIYPTHELFFYSIVFHDSLHGWLGGELGNMVGTEDGGQNWFDARVITPSYPRFPIRKIKFLTPLYGYAVGGIRDVAAVIWRTANGGQEWTVQQIGSEPLYDLYYTDSVNITCFGGDFDFGAGLVTTTDAGQNWDYNFIGIWGEGRGVSFRTKKEGWVALGFSGTCMYTLDSGKTWSDIFTPDSAAVYDVVFTDSRNGYMVGNRGTILKYNARHNIAVASGWNIVSIPTISDDNLKNKLFPAATSNAFTFTKTGYTSKDTLTKGVGYWLKFPSNQTIEIIGMPIYEDTISVTGGWNMIGSVSNPVPTVSITTIPTNIISSSFYSYKNGYLVADTVKLGSGYWIKTSEDGKIIISSR